MKNKLFILSICACFVLLDSVSGIAQNAIAVAEHHLTNNRWFIRQDAMKGIGTHKAASYGTFIEFYDNKTWQSSDIIENAKTGNWHIDDKGILQLTVGNNKPTKSFKTIAFNQNEMVLQLKNLWCVRTITCIADN